MVDSLENILFGDVVHEDGPHPSFEVSNGKQHSQDVGASEDKNGWSLIVWNVGSADGESQDLKIRVDGTLRFSSSTGSAEDEKRIVQICFFAKVWAFCQMRNSKINSYSQPEYYVN